MTMQEKDRKIKEYIINISNKLNAQYNNILSNDRIKRAIEMFSNSDKEYEEVIQEISTLVKSSVEEYIKYKKEIEKLESQIITVEKDNPYFGEVYKTYVIEVLEKFEEVQNNSKIVNKKEAFEKDVKDLLGKRNVEMNQLLYQQISDSSRIKYGQSELFLGAESLTYETVANLYSTFINDINIVSNDSEGKMFCTILNNQKIFNDDGSINPNIKYNFSLIEKTYDYAQKHGKQIKFHTFLWHNAVPENLKSEIDNVQEPSKKRNMVIAFLHDYSSKLSEFIKKKGYDLRQLEALNEIANDNLISPEVVSKLKQELITLENEAQYDTVQESINKRKQRISEINSILKDDPLRNSWWREIIGDDYYIEVFKILRSNFPNTELIYNEYNEMLPCKADRIVKIIDSLKMYEQSAEGKKYPNGIFDGIGLQGHVTDMHIDKNTGGKLKITEREILYGLGTIQKSCLSAGKKLYITESDCQNINKNGQSEKNNHVYIETAKKIANGYIVWGNSDRLTWSRMYHPISKENMNGHLINSNGVPKKEWNQLKNCFNSQIKKKVEQPKNQNNSLSAVREQKTISFTKRSESEVQVANQIKQKNMIIKQQKEQQKKLNKPKVKTLTKLNKDGNPSSGYINVIVLALIVSFVAGALSVLIYCIFK